MAGGRHTQPLFDLIRRATGAAEASDRADMNPGVGWRPGMSPRVVTPSSKEKPTIRLEFKPDSAPSVDPARDADTDGSGPTLLSSTLGGNTVRMPVNAIYIASALLVLLALAGWILGWQMGSKHTSALTNEPRPTPPIREPGDAPVAPQVAPAAPPRPSKIDKKTETPTKPVTPVRADTVTGVITSKGILNGDPRESGLNYLKLAMLSRTESDTAVRFLSENGLEAFAVPVDQSGGIANNPDPAKQFFWLFASKGISTDEYTKKLTARTNTEAAAARLGMLWQKNYRGSSNFSKPGWEKYK